MQKIKKIPEIQKFNNENAFIEFARDEIQIIIRGIARQMGLVYFNHVINPNQIFLN
ncbi:hypothetical protein ACVBGC_16005 [Burkholderia stagnalis]